MTRIAILETGRPPDDLIGRFGDYPAMFRALLGEGFDMTTFDVQAGELPHDPAAFDGVIVTGSAAGVYDDLPWIAPLEDWLRAARGRTRLIGVCFGHQIMAQAFGGRVEQSVRGWGVGLHAYDVVAHEPWMRPRAGRLAIPASHQDQVTAAPPDARVITSSAFTPYAGLAWDQDAVSFQCHPEFEPEYAAALIEARRGRRIPETTADAALDGLRDADDRALLAGWIRTFLVSAPLSVKGRESGM